MTSWHKLCALIAPVQPVLQRVSCSNETLPNALKHYETHQNISLGSNGVDRLRSLQKIPMRFRGTNICISCTSSARFVSSIVSNKTIQNASKHNKTQQNMSLGSNAVDWDRSLRKIPMRLRGKNFCLNCTSSARFAPSSCHEVISKFLATNAPNLPPLDPKLIFWCVSWCLGAIGNVSLHHETRCKIV